MKRGEKFMFIFAGIVVLAAIAKGYQQFTAEERPPPKHFYEWDETGLQGHLLYRKKGCNSCHRALGTGEVGVPQYWTVSVREGHLSGCANILAILANS